MVSERIPRFLGALKLLLKSPMTLRGLRDIRTEPLVDAHSMVVAFK